MRQIPEDRCGRAAPHEHNNNRINNMGLLNWLSGARSGTVIVDTNALLDAQGLKGRSTPKDQLRVLRQLGRFAKKEKIAVTAVLIGKPLHKAPDGGLFEEVRIRYAENQTKTDKLLLKLGRRKTAVVTASKDIEASLLRRGVECLRAVTFTKALDSDGGDGTPQRTRQRRNEGGNRRRQREPRPEDQDHPPENKDRNQEAGDAPEEDKLINELIDLV